MHTACCNGEQRARASVPWRPNGDGVEAFRDAAPATPPAASAAAEAAAAAAEATLASTRMARGRLSREGSAGGGSAAADRATSPMESRTDPWTAGDGQRRGHGKHICLQRISVESSSYCSASGCAQYLCANAKQSDNTQGGAGSAGGSRACARVKTHRCADVGRRSSGEQPRRRLRRHRRATEGQLGPRRGSAEGRGHVGHDHVRKDGLLRGRSGWVQKRGVVLRKESEDTPHFPRGKWGGAVRGEAGWGGAGGVC